MQPGYMADIGLVQTGRTPAFPSLGAATVHPVVLSQRGVLSVDSALHCVDVDGTSVHHHMAEFSVNICCECKQGRVFLFLMYRS